MGSLLASFGGYPEWIAEFHPMVGSWGILANSPASL
jgi:hypothetical protein